MIGRAQPSIEDEMKRMGKDASRRINDFTIWAKTVFNPDEFGVLEGLATTASGFGVLEKMRGMMRDFQISTSDNAKSVSSMTQEKLYEMVADERYSSSPSFRKEVDNKFKEFFGAHPTAEVRG